MILREIKNMYIKNRLTEGVDFVRKEWLKGDGEINYDKPINYLSDNLRIKIRNLDSNRGYNIIWVGGETNPGKNDWSRCIIDFEVVNGVAIKQVQWCEYVYRNGYYRRFPISSDNIYTFDININRAIINGVTYSMTSSRCNVTTPFVIKLRKADSIAYCKLNNVDMYPCKLLKTIPATLDANNRARSAGECGMYDSISGKFYGNVADSGTFTVEGDVEPETHSCLQQIYQNRLIEGVDYETYDWLKGDNTAKIEWTANLWNNQLHTIIGKDKKNFIYSNEQYNLTIFYKSDADYLMVIFRSGSSGHIADINPFPSMPDVVDFKFYIDNNIGYCKRNNELFTGGTMTTEWNDDVKFYIYGGKMQLLEEYDSVNDKLISSLVPCQLLHAIPRNLDAQCKERQAGECGMIDLISGKFYGNVASSGTFTVENDNNE